MRAGTGWTALDAASVVCPDCQRAPRADPAKSEPLYTYVNGEPMISAEGMSVLYGIPLDVVHAEFERQGGRDNTGPLTVPGSWTASGRARTEEYKRVTGGDDILGALEFWAKRDGKTFKLHDDDNVLPDGPLPSQAVIVDDDGVPSAILDVDLIQSAAIRLMYDMAANSGSQGELERISARYMDEIGVDLFGYVTAAALKFMTSNVLEPTLAVLDGVAPQIDMRGKLVESALNARLT
ncbi:hypothetical protein R3Q06_18055 [Rhodococcus erythropolis]|uniref:hypothetical protein n=1 Tax=Rhodococcus erythropolis TaxID=1833 RepID=UPI00294A5C08|nr:hypothetical protein [Rhodococcus erythropolis]MDV6275402.1 hypothetical protein [Rhodococcus erythropolis]